ncbi:prepilin-type N-terminal cleavage/methylation domain-containing protein [Bdellovibrio sp. SKB1291214]|uniref:prepilin-type N-terminal cleavage/methylation domain-containing protein n=1 Tax=Bdellovibrio sp. SKB1291214 TaxID=1732569 RepID=UPI000B51A52C|nr:prepilin-type N-terminal cleavage/methylation domain-containing protein [Bdellovibrio sp. SKB1291214]UYL08356.1 prepilin-type N-terminal cleavage/methylation domain-containing protein [Bdellovibrio sp. SKB1291214]
MNLRNNRGYTMVEILAATVITAIVSYSTYSYISYLARVSFQLKLSRVANDNVQAIVESIRFNLSLYQVSFNQSISKEEAVLKADALPWGLSKGEMIPRSDCATKGCQAYFGYVIIPSLFVKNLYQVDLKVATAAQNNSAMKWKEDQWKKYTYYITVK